MNVKLPETKTVLSQLSAFDGVSRETIEDLEVFVAELLRWNKRINLIGRGTEQNIWTRHILDCVQLWPLAQQRTNANWVDLGSGAGLPGLVLAIIAKHCQMNVRLSLVESDTRKAAFLSAMKHQLDLNVSVLSERIESIAPLNADIITARALAPLPVLLSLAHRHMADTADLLFPKGRGYPSELDAAKVAWIFDIDVAKSIAEPGAVILKINGLKRK